MAEYRVVCTNLAHDYREAVGFNLRKNKARFLKVRKGVVIISKHVFKLGFCLFYSSCFLFEIQSDRCSPLAT